MILYYYVLGGTVLLIWTTVLIIVTKYLKTQLYDTMVLLQSKSSECINSARSITAEETSKILDWFHLYANGVIDYYINNYMSTMSNIIKMCENLQATDIDQLKKVADDIAKAMANAEIFRNEHKHFVDIQISKSIKNIKEGTK